MKVFRSGLQIFLAVGLSLLFSCTQSTSDNLSDLVDDSAQYNKIIALSNPEKVRQQQQQLDSLFRVLQKRKGFNGTVLITQYNKVIYKGAFGYADFDKKDTLTTQNSFQLASVSKQFTAMAIMMLQEAGKLKYDDDVQRFFRIFLTNALLSGTY